MNRNKKLDFVFFAQFNWIVAKLHLLVAYFIDWNNNITQTYFYLSDSVLSVSYQWLINVNLHVQLLLLLPGVNGIRIG